MINSKEKKTVASNYFALLLIQGANFILPFITFPYLVRVLESEKYGLVMIAQSVAIFLTIIVDFGFNISATREVSNLRNDKKELSQYFWNVFFIKSLLLVASLLILLILVSNVTKFNEDPLVYFYSFGLVFGQAIFPTWFFQGIEKMRVITIINISAKAFFTFAIFFFILSPNDYLLVPILSGLGFIISGLLGLIYSFKYISFQKPQIKQSIRIAKESFSLLVSNLAVSLYTSSNVLILGFFGGDVIAGVYASIEKLVIASKSIYIPLYQALFPNISKKSPEEIFNLIKTIILPISLLGLFITCILIFQAKNILNLVFDDSLISNYYFILQIVGLIAFFSSLNMLLVTLYFPAIKKYNLRVKILVFSGLIHIVFAIVLAYFFKISGVAISAVLTELIILIYAFKFFKKKYLN